MPSDSGDRRPAKPHHVGAPAQEPEQLPCPRCDSINTKFCYYNNYNFSQPRHFCKSCRRYWTHGGTLRDIPIGGGSRKNAKRSRTTSATSASLQDHHHHHHMPATPTSILVPFAPDHGGAVPFVYEAKGNLNLCGSFTSLLNTQGPAILGLGGFGLGFSPGFEDVNFGLGRSVWPFPAAVPEGGATGEGGGSGSSMIGNSWQIESEDGFVGGDCFSLPDLAISTPGSGLK